MDEEVQIGEGNFCNLNVTGWGRKKRITLPHTAYDRYKGWIATKPQGNPELPLQAAVCVSGYQQLKGVTQKSQDQEPSRHKGSNDSGGHEVHACPWDQEVGAQPLVTWGECCQQLKVGVTGGSLGRVQWEEL